MRRHSFLSFVFLGLLLAACAASTSAAQLPQPFRPSLDHYRFLPRLSVINQQGGFAGVDVDWRVIGTFDFQIAQSPLAVYPPIFSGDLQNVDAWGIRPDRNYAVNLNQALNLENLIGFKTYATGQPWVFRFQGTTGDGSTVRLDASLSGPWFYLRGGTTPPAGSADFFKYSIRAVARKAPFADVNDDGVVDRTDLAAISGKFGNPNTGADFLAWQQQLGEPQPTIAELDAQLDAALAASAGGAVTAVPEPSGLPLFASGCLAISVAIRRRRLLA